LRLQNEDNCTALNDNNVEFTMSAVCSINSKGKSLSSCVYAQSQKLRERLTLETKSAQQLTRLAAQHVLLHSMALIMVISAPVGLPVYLTAVIDRVTSGAIYALGCQSTACLTFNILNHQSQQGWARLLKILRRKALKFS